MARKGKSGGLASARPSAPKKVGSSLKQAGAAVTKGSLKNNLDVGAGLVPKLAPTADVGLNAGPMPGFQASNSPSARIQAMGEGQRVARAAGMAGVPKARSKPRLGKGPRVGR